MVTCPQCGLVGLEIDNGIWKCWFCVHEYMPKRKAPPIDECPCHCSCASCQDSCDYLDAWDDDEPWCIDVLERLHQALPRGYELPDVEEAKAYEMLRVALIYTADGRVLTEVPA